MKRSGTVDLPLHGGRVPAWLAERMTQLGTAIVECMIESYGPHEFLTRISEPLWFQALGCVMDMDWHSSGITTSVMGALKRGLNPRVSELGITVCGGRGRHSKRTPAELLDFAGRVGLNGEELARTSRLSARVDNNAVADGSQLYLHSFAHGGKDGQPFPVPLKNYDESLGVLRRAFDAARLGRTEKLEGFRRLDRLTREVESNLDA